MKYPDDYINKIICGDTLTILKTMPDECVDCCITSPPYWGLRDYGTAKWEGGDEKCDHKGKIMQTHAISNRKEENKPFEIFKEVCGKCGAKRIDSQLGLEKTPEEYVAKMVLVFREVKRVLKKEGTCWLNLGDSYVGSPTGSLGGCFANRPSKKACFENKEYQKKNKPDFGQLKPKDLVGIPWRVALALQADGWYLRQDIIWHKPNPMPESVTDRCTKSHEYIFLLAKSQKYYFDGEAIKEPLTENSDMAYRRKLRCGRKYGVKRPYKDNQPLSYASTKANENAINKNKRSVWTVTTKPFKGAHFATFPPDLIEPMVLAGCPKGGIVIDIFMGSGTVAKVSRDLGRQYMGIELNPEYIKIANRRLSQGTFDF